MILNFYHTYSNLYEPAGYQHDYIKMFALFMISSKFPNYHFRYYYYYIHIEKNTYVHATSFNNKLLDIIFPMIYL